MKFALVVLAVLAIASPLTAWKIPSAGSGALAKDLQQLLDLIPEEEVLRLVKRYLVQDKEFQTATELAQSDESKEFLKFVEASPKFIELMTYMQNAGIDVYYLMNVLNEFLGLEPVASFAQFRESTGGLLGFLKELTAIVPLEKMQTLFVEMRKNSPVFNNYVEELISSKYWDFYYSIRSNEHLLKLNQEAEEAGIESQLFDRYYILFTMGVPLVDRLIIVFQFCRYIQSRLKEYIFLFHFISIERLPLILKEESLLIVIRQIRSVYECQIKSLINIRVIKNVAGALFLIAFLNIMLTKYVLYNSMFWSDVNILPDTNGIHRVPVYKHINHSKTGSSDTTLRVVSLEGSRSKTSKMKFAFAILAVLAVVSPLMAFKLPKSGSGALAKEIQSFLNLIPDKKLTKLLKTYYAQDEQFQLLMKLVDTEDARDYVAEMEAVPEMIKLLDYIQEAGVDIYSLVNKLNSALELESIVPPATYMKITGGISGFLEDLIALVPVNKIIKLYEYKMKKSKVFSDYVKEITSPKYNAIWDASQNNEHLIKFAEQAKAANMKGVDQAYLMYIGINAYLKR
ncbi:uncharacterized protein LOC143148417 [Ptiloglossa arizonensis]|uniref:uncharacterized protein LOC143148417 n=1 Tax=Ptiloglossa arizonensis TaxID=3350558 RepID=UPI003F9F6FD5